MPSATLKSAEGRRRLNAGGLLFIPWLIVVAGLAIWFTHKYSSHGHHAESLEAVRYRVQLSVQVLTDSLHAALVAAEPLQDPADPADNQDATAQNPLQEEPAEHKVRQAEASLKRQLDQVLSLETAPALLSATRDLRDYLVGPLRSYHDRLFDEPPDSRRRLALLSARHAAIEDNLDGLFSRFSTQVDRAKVKEEKNARIALIAGLVVLPAVMLLGVFAHRAPRGTGPIDELSEALGRLRRGDLNQKLAWDRPDGFGVAAREIDNLGDRFSKVLSAARQAAEAAGDLSSKLRTSEGRHAQAGADLVSGALGAGKDAEALRELSTNLSGQAARAQAATQSTLETATAGVNVVISCETALRDFAAALDSTALKLSAANEKTASLPPVISTIGRIADEASLLSLNAAIEAEKAGEYGLGFTVVAMEIRRFSEQAQAAANELGKLAQELDSIIRNSAAEARTSSDGARQAGKSASESAKQLQSALMQAQSLTILCSGIVESSRGNAAGAQKICEKLTKLAGTASASPNGQLQQAASELEKAAKALDSAITGWST
jgi:methyl-accepting chemotaxis protein WspA